MAPDPSAPAGGGPAEEERLLELLRGVRAPAAGAGFRAALRAAFARGALAPKDAASPSLAGLDGRSAAGVIEALLEDLAEPPAARPAFRDDLRRRFARGELRPSDALDAGRPAARPGARRAGPALRLSVGGLASAAALWLVWALLAPSGPTWRARLAAGAGPVEVGGRALDPRDLSELGPAFAAGRAIKAGDRRIELVRDDELVLVLLPGAELEALADGTGGAGGSELRFALRRGEVYLKSAPGYADPPVVVETPFAEMRMTGTVVGVLATDALACICVARGSVDVHAHAHDPAGARVCSADHRRVVFEDGAESGDAFADLPGAGGAHVADLQAFALAPFP